jgi:hypothetical protein
METKQYIALEVQKGEFTFSFQMPTGSTWGNALDASFDILQKLNELSQQSIQALKPAVVESEEAMEVPCQEGE